MQRKEGKRRRREKSKSKKSKFHTLKTLAASGSFSKSISKGSISTSIKSWSKSKSMSLSLSKDDSGGAPLSNEKTFNNATAVYQEKQLHKQLTSCQTPLRRTGHPNSESLTHSEHIFKSYIFQMNLTQWENNQLLQVIQKLYSLKSQIIHTVVTPCPLHCTSIILYQENTFKNKVKHIHQTQNVMHQHK